MYIKKPLLYGFKDIIRKLKKFIHSRTNLLKARKKYHQTVKSIVLSQKIYSYKQRVRRYWMNCKKRIPVVFLSTRRLIMIASSLVLVVVMLLSAAKQAQTVPETEGASVSKGQDIIDKPNVDKQPPISDREEEEEELLLPDLPVLDLSSSKTVRLDTNLLRINEPTPWGREIIFSGGNAASIDMPVLVGLYVYNLDTGLQQQIAKSEVQFGEIYEGRLNADWMVWLDTDQKGLNYIYEMNRKTGEIKQVKKCGYIRPQLRLYGDNLLWVEQIGPNEDRLYLYNFNSGEPVILDTFDSPSYGTSPPSVQKDVVVWSYPHPDDPDRSIIKKLDLKQALSVSDNNDYDYYEYDENIAITILPEGMNAWEDDYDYDDEEEGIEPDIIIPGGFAIYPVTNGSAIAWLDGLNPARSSLKLTVNDGRRIISVAEGVGRIFGVGNTFVAYMQNGAIMLYFWEVHRYATLTAEGEAGRLSDTCVAGNTVVWYANQPNQTKDIVKISIIEQPTRDR